MIWLVGILPWAGIKWRGVSKFVKGFRNRLLSIRNHNKIVCLLLPLASRFIRLSRRVFSARVAFRRFIEESIRSISIRLLICRIFLWNNWKNIRVKMGRSGNWSKRHSKKNIRETHRSKINWIFWGSSETTNTQEYHNTISQPLWPEIKKKTRKRARSTYTWNIIVIIYTMQAIIGQESSLN